MKSSVVNLLLTAPFCAAWVLYSPFAEPYSKDQTKWLSPSSFDLAEQVARWDQPTDVFSDSALGGGIAWALSPNFCENLLPIFKIVRLLRVVVVIAFGVKELIASPGIDGGEGL